METEPSPPNILAHNVGRTLRQIFNEPRERVSQDGLDALVYKELIGEPPYAYESVVTALAECAQQTPQLDDHLNQVVLKVASRCNLACDYCYEYEGPDQSWRLQPHVIDPETLGLIAARIGGYTERHQLSNFGVAFHGGEPLLAGGRAIQNTAETLRSAMPEEVSLRIGMQTNAVLLNERLIREVLAKQNIEVSVSVDGGQMAHDRHRLLASQRGGSYAQVMRGVEALQKQQYPFSVLCVIDVRNDPIEVYESLVSLGPASMDFLLSHGTWDSPPLGRDKDAKARPYADWLIAAFDSWYDDKNSPPVRFFRSLIDLSLGRASSTEVLGTDNGHEVVIRTDGSYELVDSLKMTYDGAVKTAMNVRDHDLETVAAHMRSVKSLGAKSLSQTCQNCDLVQICGGGHVPHRYSQENEFDNPSVYCPDLKRIIRHVRRQVAYDLHATGAAISRRRWDYCH